MNKVLIRIRNSFKVGSVGINSMKVGSTGGRKESVRARNFDLVQGGFTFLAGNIAKTLMQIIPRLERALMRCSSTVLWPAESAVVLDYPVSSRFKTSLRQRCPPCGGKVEGIHEIFDIVINDGVHSGDGRHDKPYDITVEILFVI